MIQDAIETSRVLEASTKEARVWHFSRISGLYRVIIWTSSHRPFGIRRWSAKIVKMQEDGRELCCVWLMRLASCGCNMLQYHLILPQYPADSCCLSRMGMVNSISTNLMLLWSNRQVKLSWVELKQRVCPTNACAVTNAALSRFACYEDALAEPFLAWERGVHDAHSYSAKYMSFTFIYLLILVYCENWSLTCFSPLQVPNIHLWTANGYWLKQRPLPVKKGQPDCPACFETGGGASVALHHLMSGLLENFMYCMTPLLAALISPWPEDHRSKRAISPPRICLSSPSPSSQRKRDGGSRVRGEGMGSLRLRLVT